MIRSGATVATARQHTQHLFARRKERNVRNQRYCPCFSLEQDGRPGMRISEKETRPSGCHAVACGLQPRRRGMIEARTRTRGVCLGFAWLLLAVGCAAEPR